MKPRAQSPLISICVPVFNRVALFQRALDSALAQTATGLEIIVLDNCSTDGTWELATSYQDDRLRCARNPRNLGLWGNMNRCLEVAQGEFIRILCSDDQLSEGTIVRELEMMQRHPQVALLSGTGPSVNDRGRCEYLNGDHLPPGIYSGPAAIANLIWIWSAYGYNPLNFPSGILFRRDAARQAGWFDAQIESAGDMDYWLRLLEFGDLGISGQRTCVIGLHAQTASRELYFRGAHMRGQFQVAQRWLGLLQQFGWRREVLAQFGARCYWHVLRSVLLGRPRTAWQYLRMPQQYGARPSECFVALAHHFRLRLLRRWRGVSLTRLQPAPW